MTLKKLTVRFDDTPTDAQLVALNADLSRIDPAAPLVTRDGCTQLPYETSVGLGAVTQAFVRNHIEATVTFDEEGKDIVDVAYVRTGIEMKGGARVQACEARYGWTFPIIRRLAPSQLDELSVAARVEAEMLRGLDKSTQEEDWSEVVFDDEMAALADDGRKEARTEIEFLRDLATRLTLAFSHHVRLSPAQPDDCEPLTLLTEAREALQRRGVKV